MIAYALSVVVGHKYVRFVGGKETVVIDILQVSDTTVRRKCRQKRVRKTESDEKDSRRWMSLAG